MGLKLKFADANPSSSGWTTMRQVRATTIQEEIAAVRTQDPDVEAILVMDRDTGGRFEWRVYAFHRFDQLTRSLLAEETKAYKEAGFLLTYHVAEKIIDEWKASYLVPKPGVRSFSDKRPVINK